MRERFEKESLDQDFILVKNCDKKPNKIVHKTKTLSQAAEKLVPSEEKFYLSDLLGISPPKNSEKLSVSKSDPVNQPALKLWSMRGDEEEGCAS